MPYRREITWSIFDEKANRVANMLLSWGIRKGQKVAILVDGDKVKRSPGCSESSRLVRGA